VGRIVQAHSVHVCILLAACKMINAPNQLLKILDYKDDPALAEHLLARHCAAACEPLLIRHATAIRSHAEVLTLFAELAALPVAETHSAHIGLPREALLQQGLEPEYVSVMLNQRGFGMRKLSSKLWLQPAGNLTPFHFDGNSLCGLNLQLLGRKRWTIVSPETPLPMLTFSHWARTRKNFEPKSSRYKTTTFVTQPGDLLFTPRYWCHRVEALEPTNANLNWVYTPSLPDSTTTLGRREFEMVGLIRDFPTARRLGLLASLPRRYGLGEQSLADNYANRAPARQKFLRLVKELFGFPVSLLRYPSVRRQVRQLRQNNFAPMEP